VTSEVAAGLQSRQLYFLWTSWAERTGAWRVRKQIEEAYSTCGKGGIYPALLLHGYYVISTIRDSEITTAQVLE
jgi:hypothetical protein